MTRNEAERLLSEALNYLAELQEYVDDSSLDELVDEIKDAFNREASNA